VGAKELKQVGKELVPLRRMGRWRYAQASAQSLRQAFQLRKILKQRRPLKASLLLRHINLADFSAALVVTPVLPPDLHLVAGKSRETTKGFHFLGG
jgi:hypothetical protein